MQRQTIQHGNTCRRRLRCWGWRRRAHGHWMNHLTCFTQTRNQIIACRRNHLATHLSRHLFQAHDDRFQQRHFVIHQGRGRINSSLQPTFQGKRQLYHFGKAHGSINADQGVRGPHKVVLHQQRWGATQLFKTMPQLGHMLPRLFGCDLEQGFRQYTITNAQVIGIHRLFTFDHFRDWRDHRLGHRFYRRDGRGNRYCDCNWCRRGSDNRCSRGCNLYIPHGHTLNPLRQCHQVIRFNQCCATTT